MTEYTITQEQIDALLAEVSIEDRIQHQYARIKNRITRMLHNSASRDLFMIKKELGACIKILESNRPFTPDFIDSFKAEYRHLSRDILKRTRDFALFELVVKLENMIDAMFYEVDHEERRYPRFPLTTDLTLTLEGRVHKLLGADIACVGMSFYSPVALKIGRRYDICIQEKNNESLTVDILRVSPVTADGPLLFWIGAAFPNLLTWQRIREIIKASMEHIS